MHSVVSLSQLENATMQAEYNTLLWDNVILNKKVNSNVANLRSQCLYLVYFYIHCNEVSYFIYYFVLVLQYSIGGAVFSFTDEWWKGREGQYDDRHQECPSSDPRHE